MKASGWNTYRTRFLVKAKRLSASLTFTDALGREHSGRKGDYLVESSDGVLSIAPRRIFEDVYVLMGLTEIPSRSSRSSSQFSGNLPAVSVRKPPQPYREGSRRILQQPQSLP